MKRNFTKYIGLAFFVAGVCILIFALSTGQIFFILFGGIWTAVGFYKFSRIRKLQTKNFAWYKNKYPGAISEQGKVSCYACSNRSVRIRNLFQGTFTREHLCGECGATLFYSEEG